MFFLYLSIAFFIFSVPSMLLIGYIGELLEERFELFKKMKKKSNEEILYPKEYQGYIEN